MQVGGLSLICKIQQGIVQDQMEQMLGNNATVFDTLTIPLADFEKIKTNPNEMSLQGKMYDIKTIKIKGDKVELQVLNDAKEERIFDHLKTLASQQPAKNKSQANCLLDLIGLMYVFSGSSVAHPLSPPAQPTYHPLCEMIISQTKSVFSPPPEMV